MSQRAFAKKVVAKTGGNAENERRQLLKYLAGTHAPERDRAKLYAEILDKPGDYFIDDTPTRVADQVQTLLGLVAEIKAIVDERLPERRYPIIEIAEEMVRQLDAGAKVPARRREAAARELEEQIHLIELLAARLREDGAAARSRGARPA